jgi:negative regulator of flagellin synthesis FlgM
MNRIDGSNPLATSRLGQGLAPQQVNGERTAEADATGVASGRDLANISSRGRFVADTVRAAQDSPDVRADKVAALKAAITNGNYHSNARDIAVRLMAGGTIGQE